MTILAKIVADSVSPQGIRLTTMQLRYPKFIHGEFMTHRVMSRNASSSRAIPVERMIQDVLNDPAMPVFWGKNQKGMQAVEELCGHDQICAQERWLFARDAAVEQAKAMLRWNVHKQIVNRIIEPWAHINVVCTATDWANFFALRRHPDAQPEMRVLADAMWEALEASTSVKLQPGEWHVPYVTHDDFEGVCGGDPLEEAEWNCLIKLSVARCARVSYLTHEGKPPRIEEDLKLYDRLVGSVPLHSSPAEHQATPDVPQLIAISDGWRNEEQHGNFTGWRQWRKFLVGENVKDR
jgi:hypothetical protein